MNHLPDPANGPAPLPDGEPECDEDMAELIDAHTLGPEWKEISPSMDHPSVPDDEEYEDDEKEEYDDGISWPPYPGDTKILAECPPIPVDPLVYLAGQALHGLLLRSRGDTPEAQVNRAAFLAKQLMAELSSDGSETPPTITVDVAPHSSHQIPSGSEARRAHSDTIREGE